MIIRNKKDKKSKKLINKRNIIKLAYILILFLLIIVSSSISFVSKLQQDLPSPDKLIDRGTNTTNTIYDKDGNILFNLYDGKNRQIVKIDNLADHTKWAILAAEDIDFYNHRGVDYIAMGRCLILTTQSKLTGGKYGITCGASTITQQLVRNTIMYDAYKDGAFERSNIIKTITRKTREVILAIEIERKYSKDDILQMYLNEIPFGGPNYGIQAASIAYFDKNANELNLSESAMLAGLLQAPSAYNPVFGNDSKNAFSRQSYVFAQLSKHSRKTGIEKEDIENAKLEEISFIDVQNRIVSPHFVIYAIEEAKKLTGIDFYNEPGYSIITSLDPKLQEIAEKEIDKKINEEYRDKYNVNNASMVAIDPKTFQIVSMIGSANYWDESELVAGKYNMTTAKRQPASTVKPYAYLGAIEAGYNLGIPLPDLEELSSVYGTVNADFTFDGIITARKALSRSRNITALYLTELIGVDNYLQTANRAGVMSMNERRELELSLVLGVGEISLLENVSGFSVFASEGVKKNVSSIEKILDNDGNIIYEHKDEVGEQAFSKESIYQLNWALCDLGGFGDRLRDQDPYNYYKIDSTNALCGKTGTTDGPRDLYSIMYHKNLVLGLWYGNNNNVNMPDAWSYNTALPTASSIMNSVKDIYKPELYEIPEGIAEAEICEETGLLYNKIGDKDGNKCKKEKIVYLKKNPIKSDNRRIVQICNSNGKIVENQPFLNPPANAFTYKLLIPKNLELKRYENLYLDELSRIYAKTVINTLPQKGECPEIFDSINSNNTNINTISAKEEIWSFSFDGTIRTREEDLVNITPQIHSKTYNRYIKLTIYKDDTIISTQNIDLPEMPNYQTYYSTYDLNLGQFVPLELGMHNIKFEYSDDSGINKLSYIIPLEIVLE